MTQPFFATALRAAVAAFDRLDLAYLQQWAGELDVGDLLARALRDAGLG